MVASLKGIKGLAWTQRRMGPYTAAMLAELEGEEIHIENPVTGAHGRGSGQT